MDRKQTRETTGSEEPSLIDLAPHAADAVSDLLTDVGLELERHEAEIIANEILQEFTSMQRAAGATSQVSIVNNPQGGVESARSTKMANFVYNIKSAALAIPVPALAGVMARNDFTTNLRISMGAITALFLFLSGFANALNIPLTRQAAAILQHMWTIADPGSDIVQHDGLLEKVNAQFERFNWRTIDSNELVSYLEALEKIGCIERATDYNPIQIERIQWRLRERSNRFFESKFARRYFSVRPCPLRATFVCGSGSAAAPDFAIGSMA